MAAISPVFAFSVPPTGDASIGELRWRAGVIRIAISPSLLRESSNIKSDSDVAGAIRRSIDSWSRVANVELRQVSSEKLSVSPSGPTGDGVSLITIAQTPENVLLFAKDPEGAAATTRIFYNRRGLITEADIVLNPYQQFSTDGTIGTFDLESTLTHEIGHLLGLPHSEVLGATMHASYGKNGIFGMQRLTSRTLATDDIASIRSIYGAREDSECCGRIDGKLLVPGKHARAIEVWVEDFFGRVHGSTKVGATGDFAFAGLREGKYRLFAHEPARTRNSIAAQEVGVASVTSGETSAVTAKVVTGGSQVDFGLTRLGFNGQLSQVAVAATPGRSYIVYLGGRNLDVKDISIGFNSPDLSVVQSSIRSLDYGEDISVVSFEVRVSARAKHGEYTLFAELRGSDRRAMIGGITVDNFFAPGSSFATFDD
ncbi:MAG TPA: matrixin family metalloprotease [Pyrinomonadaceae bacterium]|nr:matrixin family metalloprotease [Pyrinomonadaceae bacterium]